MNDIQQDYIPNSILIIGNGLDLDLGLKTKYIDFANSEYWPFKEKFHFEKYTLPYFLNSHKNQVNTWFDLEDLLAIYASKHADLTQQQIKEAKELFGNLIANLKVYLRKQENTYINQMNSKMGEMRKMKTSHYVLQEFFEKKRRKIYSFNYTNTYKIVKQLIIDFEEDVMHIHGSLRDNNIILGIGDQREISDDFFEFYKSASPHYCSNNLIDDLNNADEIYIFGHSLGKNDHDYFSDFFKMASCTSYRTNKSNKIKLRIFTLDEKSELELKKQLMTLTDHNLQGLYSHCDFKIVKNDELYIINDNERL